MSESLDSVQIVCQRFYPELISTGQTITELCEDLVDRGVAVEVLCGSPTILNRSEPSPSVSEYKGIKVRRLWSTRFSKLFFPGRVLNQLTFSFSAFMYLIFVRKNCPVIVTTTPPFLSFICALGNLFKRRKMVHLLLDLYPHTLETLGVIKRDGVLARFWKNANHYIFAQADCVVVIGRCMLARVRAELAPSVHNKTKMIKIWADHKTIQPISTADNPYFDKWNLRGKFTLLYSGNMGRYHDFDTILNVAASLQAHQDIEFLFVGEGHKKALIEEEIKAKKLLNCRVYPHVEREDLSYSLSCADLGLVSLMPGHEGLSVPSKSFAMIAAGAPILAIMNDNSEVAQMVREFDCGRVVQPGDVALLKETILNIYKDRSLLESLRRNARATFLQHYSLNRIGDEYENLIRSLN